MATDQHELGQLVLQYLLQSKARSYEIPLDGEVAVEQCPVPGGHALTVQVAEQRFSARFAEEEICHCMESPLCFRSVNEKIIALLNQVRRALPRGRIGPVHAPVGALS
jgi:hypothetical protein